MRQQLKVVSNSATDFYMVGLTAENNTV